jgi:predicted nucleic acid-binding protein
VPFYQFDASAAVKRYVTETGSGWVRTITTPGADNVISLADVTRAEVASALARRAREGSITVDESLELIRAFETHCLTDYRVVPTEHLIVGMAVELILQHPLRAYDAIQLATAVRINGLLISQGLPSPILVSADDRLLAAAQAEGLATDNPNEHL